MARLVTSVSRTRRSSSYLSLAVFLLVLLLLFATVARSAKITFIRKNGKTYVIKTGGDDWDDDDDDLEETDGEDDPKREGADSAEAGTPAGSKKATKDSDEPKRGEAIKAVKSPESAAAAAEAAAAAALAAMADDPLVEKYKQEPLDPGSWRTAVEMPLADVRRRAEQGDAEALWALGVKRLVGAGGRGGVARDIPKALLLLERSAEKGFPHAHSALGFLHASGYGVPLNQVKAFLHHTFAANGGSVHSKMALAFSHLRQQEFERGRGWHVKAFLHHTFAANGGSVHSKMALAFSHLRQQEFERAAALYADVAAKSMAVNSLPGQAPLIETVHLSAGGEESLEATRGHRGEADETIQGGQAPLIETVHLSAGGEESLEATRGHRAEGTGQRAQGRGHRAEGTGQRAQGRGHRAEGTGQRAQGRGHRAEADEAIQFIELQASRGAVEAIRTLGTLYYWGARGMPRDHVRAFGLMKKAAEMDDLHVSGGHDREESCREESCREERGERREERGDKSARRHADAGPMHAGPSPLVTLRHLKLPLHNRPPQQAMLTLGEMLTHGVGCKANPVEAMVWFNKAYARGLVSALNGVGYLHAKGLGVPQDYHKAVQNFLTAARKTRDVDALYNLGMSHLRGQGVRRNPSKALRFLQQAVEGQHVGAMYQMGKMHLTGTGVPKNVVMGVGLGTSEEGKGASGWQHVGAMYQMGKMHLTGTGVPKNVVMVRWVHKYRSGAHGGSCCPWGVMLPLALIEAARLLKAVTERGPWGVMLRWAHACFMSSTHGPSLGSLSVPSAVIPAARLLKAVAERGPWGVMLRWAHACFMSSTQGPSLWSLSRSASSSSPFSLSFSFSLSSPLSPPSLRSSSSSSSPSAWPASCDVGTSLMLYSRAAELGYEVAQGNAAWLLDKCVHHFASCDVATSWMFYSRAAELGCEVAQGNAAWLRDKISLPASCDVATSWMFYSRAAELGCEVAQGNAAWLLDKIRWLVTRCWTMRVVGDSVLDNACVGAPRSTATSTATSSSSASSASPEAVQKDREATDGVASDENNAVGGEGSASGGEGSRGAEAGATGGEPSQGDELEGGGVVQGEGGRAEEQQEQNEQKGQKEQQERSKDSVTSGRRGWRRCSEAERHERSHRLWQLAAEQGSVQAALLLGDAFFYGRGQPRDLQRAAEAYWRAREKGSAHAMFNLGFMHEHGMGLPRDLHLAKRFYDQVLDAFPRAVVPVRIALFGLWLRMQYGHYPLVSKALDVLPEIGPATAGALKAALRDDTNAYIASLLALLLAVLFLRSQRRQQRVVQA
ncbi:unnamed protein product [Closterium sp. NIES-65]|nr:unnamed protein product [Closterium sp. NIES-65]